MVIFLYSIASRFCSKEITQRKNKLSIMMYRGSKRIMRLITVSMSLFSPKLIYRVKNTASFLCRKSKTILKFL